MTLLSQEKLHDKQVELNQGKDVDDPTLYLWECGPIEQGASLETICPRAEFICIMMLATECVNAVRDIRSSDLAVAELARKYNAEEATIYCARVGQTWKFVR